MGHLKASIAIVGVCGVFLGCQSVPSGDFRILNPFPIEVTGENFEWSVRYPGKDGLLDTSDDILSNDAIHLPAHSSVLINLNSADYLYFVDFSELPEMAMAVPGLEKSISFTTKSPRSMEFKGHQMCGYSHQSLIKKVIVQSESQLMDWFEDLK